MNFWEIVNAQLDHIEEAKPSTSEKVIEVMNLYRTDYGVADGEAFFEGSGGDRQLEDSLRQAGWYMKWLASDFHWVMQHSTTGDKIYYVEGDVYDWSKKLIPSRED